ncbi:glycoside hydrolase superfamily [Gymnopilus junonius]|uniref:Glycoside hydrolase superfamily n=1 Tax=Gymnopilus junonius TaxID=109634 RepID=A0A9P5NQP8_GYMJU|nr:glycoside hydrolase superfamily [Gymnopilus junonius]
MPTPSAGGVIFLELVHPENFSSRGLERLWDIFLSCLFLSFCTPAYIHHGLPRPLNILTNLTLPKDFFFGVATAAFQVEGLPRRSRQPGGVADNSTGDVVDLQYYLYKEDVARVAAIGVNAHSFSISWARIFPFGTADSPVNQAALDHYSDLIDYHIASGVTPVATLFHWDTPLSIQAYYGGFLSPQVVDDFVNYAKTVFKAFNGKVKTWYTFNEPRVYYFSLPAGVNSSTAPYICSYHLLKAHAGAVKAFREMKTQGEIAFKNDDFVGIPWRANNTEDLMAVERHAAFRIGAFSNPAYTTGDWPTIMTDTLPPSFLPRFTAEEKKDLLGSADFFATDAYRTQFVTAPPDGIASCVSNMSHPLWPECHTVVEYDVNGWAAGISPDPVSDWLQATPNFLRQSLRDLQARWPTKKMYISEFGFVEPFEEKYTDLFRITEDVARTNYYMTYLGEILLAIHEDKLPIAGIFAWAMIDNIEWGSGIQVKFGIQYVNFTTLERQYKRSALSLSEFFKAHLEK